MVGYFSFAPVKLPGAENDFNATRSPGNTVPDKQRIAFQRFFDGQAHLAEGLNLLAVQDSEQVLRATDIRPYFREAAQWHLAVAYLKSGQPRRAAHVLNALTDCIDCEYPVSTLDRWKLRWQIQWAEWFS